LQTYHDYLLPLEIATHLIATHWIDWSDTEDNFSVRDAKRLMVRSRDFGNQFGGDLEFLFEDEGYEDSLKAMVCQPFGESMDED